MELGIILAYALGLIALYIIVWVLATPLKFIGKIVVKAAIGVIILFITNFIGNFIGVSVTINPLTATIVGILGIPGVVLMVAINKL